MRMYGVDAVHRWTWRMWRITQPRALILLYHRVAELSSDPQLMSVTPQHFAKHLEHIRRHYYPVSLSELGRSLSAKHVPHRAVVLTFDDGYADNLWNAKPLLEHYDIPATVFVTTGYVGQKREFWWDELERLLLLPSKLPDSIELAINVQVHSWQLEDSEKPLDIGSQFGNRWDVTMGICPTPRHKAYKELHRLLTPLDDEARRSVLVELARCAGVPSQVRPHNLALSTDELKLLAKDGLVEIGSHTITHPVLSAQPREVQQKEICESKRDLENIIGLPVLSFCFPYGNRESVGMEAIQTVQKAGFKLACANFPEPITRWSDAFWLSRCLVRDWDNEEFAHHLKSFFYG